MVKSLKKLEETEKQKKMEKRIEWGRPH